MKVPGTIAIGLIRNLSRVSTVQVSPEALRAGEYLPKSGWLPAGRPTSPSMLGPSLGPPVFWVEWQTLHMVLKVALPFSIDGLESAATHSMGAMSAAATTRTERRRNPDIDS